MSTNVCLPMYREVATALALEWKYIYDAGGAVLSAIWANYAGTVLLSNPVQADADGKFPPVFVSAGTYYDVKYRAPDASGDPLGAWRDTYEGIYVIGDSTSEGTSSSDHKWLVNVSDETAGYGADKIPSTDWITVTIGSGSVGKSLQLNINAATLMAWLEEQGFAAGTPSDHMVRGGLSDVTKDAAGYLIQKIVDSFGASLSLTDDGKIKLPKIPALDYKVIVSDSDTLPSTLYDKMENTSSIAWNILADSGQEKVVGYVQTAWLIDVIDEVLSNTDISDHKVIWEAGDVAGVLGVKLVPGAGITFVKTTDSTNGSVVSINCRANTWRPTVYPTANYAVQDSDDTIVVNDSAGTAAVTITIPDPVVEYEGRVITVISARSISNGSVAIAGNSINGESTYIIGYRKLTLSCVAKDSASYIWICADNGMSGFELSVTIPYTSGVSLASGSTIQVASITLPVGRWRVDAICSLSNSGSGGGGCWISQNGSESLAYNGDVGWFPAFSSSGPFSQTPMHKVYDITAPTAVYLLCNVVVGAGNYAFGSLSAQAV